MEIDPYSSKTTLRLLLLPLFLAWGTLMANTHLTTATDEHINRIVSVADADVKARLQLLDQSLIEHRLDPAVRSIIAYHLNHPRQMSVNIGRAMVYFPLFEAELAAAGLPATLKYLPIIESALVPRSTSRVGAQGLWQFMPSTAPEFGLRIDAWVDERLDAQRATQAAIRYLKDAYEYLGDWSLAIAAYNAGKGGVAKARKRSGGKGDFWGVQKHLPRETRHYVPAFIAAIYLTEFYAKHDITPQMPVLDEQLMTCIRVYKPLSFYRIAQVTGLSIDLIQQYNPSYKKGFLPAYASGHNLLLPERVVPALETYLDIYADYDDEPPLHWGHPLVMPVYTPDDAAHYSQFHSLAAAGDSLSGIAERLQLPASQLAIWNHLTPLDSLVAGQAIAYFRPVAYVSLPKREVVVSTPLSHRRLRTSLKPIAPADYTCLPEFAEVNHCVVLHQKTRPSLIAERFPHVDVEALLTHNQLERDKPLPAGWMVRIPNSF